MQGGAQIPVYHRLVSDGLRCCGALAWCVCWSPVASAVACAAAAGHVWFPSVAVLQGVRCLDAALILIEAAAAEAAESSLLCRSAWLLHASQRSLMQAVLLIQQCMRARRMQSRYFGSAYLLHQCSLLPDYVGIASCARQQTCMRSSTTLLLLCSVVLCS